MEIWATAEVFIDADPAQERVRRCVEPFLNAAFAASTLKTLEVKLRYVPIIMPERMRERYPARSKLRKEDGLYDCSPQLCYAVFVGGSFEDQLGEYLRGISETASHLAALGATLQQIEDFNKIMATAVERILVERPDKTRH